MFRLKPREDKFFELFIKNSELSYATAMELRDFMKDMSNPETKYGRIKELEHEGDMQVHAIFEELNKTFITPLDREDIHMIAKALDQVTDFIEQTGSRFLMYGIEKAPDSALSIADMIVDCTKELVDLMKELKPGSKPEALKKKIIEINRIEEIGDNAFRKAIKDLFVHSTSPIEVIKWKDIYENLEACLDSCEEVANIIEGVVMKNA
jgi:uncharacterized protein